MRDLAQVAAPEDLHATAQPLAAALAEETVTAAQLQALHDRTVAYKPLIGTARQQISSSLLREATVQHLAEARTALDRLDVRIPQPENRLT